MRSLPTYDQVLALPSGGRRSVPPEYGDANGHLNVRHHLALYDDAEWALFEPMGAGASAAEAGEGGVFALEQHLTYRQEVLVGEDVEVKVRVLRRSGPLLHLVSYLAVHTRRVVAGSMEGLEGWVDFGTRRLAPFPELAASALDVHITDAAALPWSPELSGSITLR